MNGFNGENKMKLVVEINSYNTKGIIMKFATWGIKQYETGGEGKIRHKLYKIAGNKITEFSKGKIRVDLNNRKMEFNFRIGQDIKSLNADFELFDLSMEDKELRIALDIKKEDVDMLFSYIVEEDIIHNKLLKEMIQSVGNTADGNAKYELVRMILEWCNTYGIINMVLNRLKQDDAKMGKVLEKINLEIGNVQLEL